MRFLLAISLVLASASTLAQEEARGPYIGLGLGVLDFKDEFRGVVAYEDTLSNYSLRGGFRFNDKLGVEAVYGSADSFSERKSGTLPLFVSSDGVFVGNEFDALVSVNEVDYVQMRVMAYATHVLFGFGYFSLDVKGNMSGTSQYDGSGLVPPQLPGAMFTTSLTDSEHGYTALVGAYWKLKDYLGLRVEYEYFDVNNPADATIFGVGIQYEF